MHQAKGLEYDHVFLVGLEDEILPHRRTHESQPEIEEERRILYVGVTRARKTLTLSRARRRATFGRYDTTTVSRFVTPIISKHLTMSPAPGTPIRSSTSNPAYQGWGTAATFQRTHTTPAAVDALQWQVGDHVRHQRFGEGIILEAKVVDDDVEVVVRFADKALGEKRLIASFARLERLARDSE
jgi:DNA helicase-2/ATP-dependent DNA helicase PcrA